jgi:stearoyl-CoA desaturase (delta-9 desaturase)
MSLPNTATTTATTVKATATEHPREIDWFLVAWFSVLHAVAIIGPFFFFSWGAVITAFVLYVLTGMVGITFGYHRLLSHRSFRAPRWLERIAATIGALALQGTPAFWVATHRMHHAFVDTSADPHDAKRGFWWSHLGWLMFKNHNLRDHLKMRKFARDIYSDPYLSWLSLDIQQITLQVALGLVLLALGGWDYVVWGVFVRVVFVYHITWLINSATHRYGYRNFDSEDGSANTWWVSILAFGEGWHNNHHAFPDVAPAGLKWWEVDPTWMLIWSLERMGIVTQVKRHK